MMLDIFICLGMLVSENEVNLVGSSAFIRSEHDGVRRFIAELIRFRSFLRQKKFQVCAAAFDAILKSQLILQDNRLVFELYRLWKIDGYSIFASFLAN